MDQKHYLFDFYLTEMSAQELAYAWGVSINNIYNYKSRFKKKSKAGDIKIELPQASDTIDRDESIEVTLEKSSPSAELPSENIEVELPNVQSTPPLSDSSVNMQQTKDPSRNYGTTLSFEGEYTKEELMKKLLTMVELLEDDNRQYKMKISFTEIS